MADRYIRSTDGSNADDGSTWALAKATLAGVASIDAAGDRLFVSQSHSETTAAAVNLALAGSVASPTQLLCANDAAEPPTTLATTGVVATTGASSIEIFGHAYVYGLTFNCGTTAVNASIQLGTSGSRQIYEDCVFTTGTGGGSSYLQVNRSNSTEAAHVDLVNCSMRFNHQGHGLLIYGTLNIRGGGALSGGQNIDSFIKIGGAFGVPGAYALVDGFDFSNWAATLNLISSFSNGQNGRVIFRNCKLPASWSGSLFAASPGWAGFRAEMYNCDSADTNYRLWVEDYCGSIKHETTLVKTGGASDGDTPIAWKMAGSANAEYPLHVLRSPEIFSEFISAVGSSKTITVDILRDSATNLKDDEIWIEVQYLGTSGRPLALFVDDAKADVLTTAADQDSSSATWTTTGMANPNKQKLSVTFTPQEKGVAIVTVCLAKASATVYVDPVAQVS